MCLLILPWMYEEFRHRPAKILGDLRREVRGNDKVKGIFCDINCRTTIPEWNYPLVRDRTSNSGAKKGIDEDYIIHGLQILLTSSFSLQIKIGLADNVFAT